MVRITNKFPSLVSNFEDIKLWIANGWILPSGGVACGQTFCDLHTLLHTFLDFLVNIKK